MEHLPEFEEWLREEGYAESTICSTVCNAKYLIRRAHSGRAPRRGMHHIARRMASFGVEMWDPKVQELVEKTMVRPQLKLRERKALRAAKRERKESSIPDEEWIEFTDIVLKRTQAESNPADAVVYLMMCTGLRIGDVCRITRHQLRSGLDSGIMRIILKRDTEHRIPVTGALQAWTLLEATTAHMSSVALALAPGGDGSSMSSGGAQAAVRSRLKEYEHLVTGRLHSHRIRRTVGVQIMRLEGLDAAKQLLIHRSPATTMLYVDELRADDLTGLHEKLAGFRKG